MDASPDHGVGCQIKILRTRSGMEHKLLLFPRQTFLAIGKEIVRYVGHLCTGGCSNDDLYLYDLRLEGP